MFGTYSLLGVPKIQIVQIITPPNIVKLFLFLSISERELTLHIITFHHTTATPKTF